jgi:hypothetical protein
MKTNSKIMNKIWNIVMPLIKNIIKKNSILKAKLVNKLKAVRMANFLKLVRKLN